MREDMAMLDHIIMTVADYEASKGFYERALEPLGYEIVMEFGSAGGFGVEGKPDFWIRQAEPVRPPVHVAFSSPDRPTVDAFYEAAIAAGGRDNGAPGLRPDYHRNYYGAFVFDPDGNNIEAVCHREF
jgi:catechol 2,3-dioxygenase-like lactoylglutathione lyase family enzyme